ncbi:MAG: hypothetical protein M1346_01250 [Gammaproteobacteria bacterium]|nr:hypothetical protein [Gammaproteobacteria bacterium]
MKKSNVTNVTHHLLVTMSALLFLISVYALLRTGVYAVSEVFHLLPLDHLIEGVIIRVLDTLVLVEMIFVATNLDQKHHLNVGLALDVAATFTIREFVLAMYTKQAFSELAVLLLAVSVMVILRSILSYRKKEASYGRNITPGTS